MVVRARYYITSKLLDLPVFGTIARASGPFPVFFKRAEEDGNFKLIRSVRKHRPSSCSVLVRGGADYMSSKLLDLTLFGATARAPGPFPVFFKRAEEDRNFKLDKGRMAEVEQDVDAHVAAGGVLCLFPEGQLNRPWNVHTPQSIR